MKTKETVTLDRDILWEIVKDLTLRHHPGLGCCVTRFGGVIVLNPCPTAKLLEQARRVLA